MHQPLPSTPLAPSNSEDELALVRRLARRDPAAMADIYDRYGGMVFTIAVRVVRDRETAEDLTQETFLRVWNRIGAFDRGRGSLSGWIAAIARHQCIDYVRSSQWKLARAAQGLESLQIGNGQRTHSASFEDRILLRHWMRKVGRTVAELPANQRLVLNLSFVDGMSHAEIARTVNRPLGTVKSWIRTALQVLRGQASIERAG